MPPPMAPTAGGPGKAEQAKAAFMTFDTDRSGYIDRQEFEKCVRMLGFQGSYETVASHEVTCEKNAASPKSGVEKALQSESGQGAPVEALLEEGMKRPSQNIQSLEVQMLPSTLDLFRMDQRRGQVLCQQKHITDK